VWTVIGYCNGYVNNEEWWSRGIVGAVFFLCNGHISTGWSVVKFNIVGGESIGVIRKGSSYVPVINSEWLLR
jgi:hypothetical protein